MSELKSMYTVTGTLRHNGKDYAPGEPIELSDQHAAPLLAVGAVEAAEMIETDDIDEAAQVTEPADEPEPKKGRKK